jgi:hypothetical protein
MACRPRHPLAPAIRRNSVYMARQIPCVFIRTTLSGHAATIDHELKPNGRETPRLPFRGHSSWSVDKSRLCRGNDWATASTQVARIRASDGIASAPACDNGKVQHLFRVGSNFRRRVQGSTEPPGILAPALPVARVPELGGRSSYWYGDETMTSRLAMGAHHDARVNQTPR